MSETLALSPTASVAIRYSTPTELTVEAVYEPGGGPPPAHLHPAQDEHFEVLEGRMEVIVDGNRRELAKGDEIEIPRGATHQMWNPADERARVSWRTRPGGRTERWFRELDSAQRAAAEGRDPPDFSSPARGVPRRLPPRLTRGDSRLTDALEKSVDTRCDRELRGRTRCRQARG